ncbi:SRPBCC domain-containing protein [Ktedonosporobacter rubrisoli]|uniref:SRPBCC domain-containing protein n=1 Tax=Ktedonosporobacter rubrisoli TaxID=2509675 RepID=A0A4P6JL81_KTERU|nr:SRPBCC domain-containing protein [Ktedonosporobacter rubrisoli]QBD75987.1 SRPBCC domain-containing protein [Ktedonosporobacter rubrisoli]
MPQAGGNREPGQVGQTKATGFQIGVRRTFSVSMQAAWNLLTSEQGLAIWLDAKPPLALREGETYTTVEGVTGEIRVINQGQNIRLTWQPPGWSRSSTVQVRTIPAGEYTTISFHQEWLPGPGQRERMRRHWQDVLARLKTLLEP